MSVYVIIADGTIDQIVEGKEQLIKERRDLRAMGCTVTSKEFPSWAEAEAYETKKRGW